MAKDYSQLSKEELLKIVEKLESRKKYGLIWDEDKVQEQFEKEAQNALPILKEIKTKEIVSDASDPINLIIEGDNYHALSVLNFTHQNKIDLIYIDPPYNTGLNDFKYNDVWVNSEDAYRHSKWLSFISKRLKLAKNLLADDGLIFISIDDNEQAQLKILCNEVFGENNFIAQVVWHRKRGKDNSAKYFSRVHEYVLVYAKNTYLAQTGRIELEDTTKAAYRNPDNDKRGPYRLLGAWARGIQGGSTYSFKSKSGKVFNERKWLFSKESLAKLDNEDRLVFVGDKVYRKLFLSENLGAIPETIWTDVSNAANAADEIKGLFGSQIFETPKPLPLIKRIIELLPNKNATVLDFMAGSGTTGHAVLEKNKQDGGSRQFILCTNNSDESGEHKIATDICYPRIKKAIKGYVKFGNKEKIEGLGGSLKYFKTAFVKNSLAKDDMKIRLANECTEMLCLREGVFDELKSTSDYKIFKQNDKILAVYYSLEREVLKDLKKGLDKLEGTKTLYCFTLDPLGLSKSDFIGWNDVVLESIPQKILDVYKQIYEY